MDPDLRGRWALARGREAATRLGLDHAGARVTRLKQSALVELPAAGAIARVETRALLDSARGQAAVGRFFADRGAPVMRLVGRGPQPIELLDKTPADDISPGAAVTVWRFIPDDGRPADLHALGRTLRDVHQRGGEPWPADVPRLRPLVLIRRHLARLAPGPVRDAFRRQADAAADTWDRWAGADPWGQVVAHGDPHLGNVISTPDGLRLVDLEFTGLGPACWDLLPMALQVRHYGVPQARLDALLAGYGADPRAWPGFERLLAIYRLLCALWTIALAGAGPEMAGEARLRTETMLDGADHRWTLF